MASGTATSTSAAEAVVNDHPHVDTSTVHYHDSPFLPLNETGPAVRSALIVLNTPIERPPSRIFQRLWDAASFRVCADGGANRLYESTAGLESSGPSYSDRRFVPDLIKGDLDSLRDDVRVHYRDLGCTIERDPDQDTNDLDKALQSVVSYRNGLGKTRRRDKRDHTLDAAAAAASPRAESSLDGQQRSRKPGGAASHAKGYPDLRVYVYGAFGGRFDQEMGSLQVLYKWGDEFGHRIVLYGDETCAFLLPAGVTSEIRLPASAIAAAAETCTGVGVSAGNSNDQRDGKVQKAAPSGPVGEGPTCGLIPLGVRCEFVRTTGLKWNLEGTVALEFGGLVSTSNRIVDEVITVQTSHPLVFTTEMVR